MERRPGTRSQYPTIEEFAMKDLKAFPGAFSFFIGDARAITQARKRGAE